MRIGEDLIEPPLVREAQKQPARPAEQLAELLAAGADRRRVDDRQQFFEVLHQQREEQGLVVVVQLAQKGIAFEVGGEAAQHHQPPRNLLAERADMRRQQTVQLEHVALGFGKGGAFVEERVGQQPKAEERRRHGPGFGGRGPSG